MADDANPGETESGQNHSQAGSSGSQKKPGNINTSLYDNPIRRIVRVKQVNVSRQPGGMGTPKGRR